MGGLRRNWGAKEIFKPEHVCPRFEEEWKVVGKGNELRVSKLGKLIKFIRMSRCLPVSLETRILLFFLVSTAHVPGRVFWPASVEKGEVRESFLHLCFLKFLQLKIYNVLKWHIWGYYILNPVKLHNPRSWRFLPVFSSKSFTVLCLGPFGVSFCKNVKIRSRLIYFFLWMSNCSNTIVKTLFLIEFIFYLCQQSIAHIYVVGLVLNSLFCSSNLHNFPLPIYNVLITVRL